MAERWRPMVGARVQRRWRPDLGVGVVEELSRGCARVRWAEAPVSKKVGADLIGWHTPSHLTRPGRRIDCGPGKDQVDLCVFDHSNGQRVPRGIGVVVPGEASRA